MEVDFAYMVIQNGSIAYPSNFYVFDRAFIKIPNVESSYIIINDSTTPREYLNSTYYLCGNLLGAELVWGGRDDGEFTTFTNMSSYLSLYYNNQGVWTPFNVIYTYGNDTEESADNLVVSLAKNGYVYVTIGNLNPKLLTSHFSPPLSFAYADIYCDIPFYVNGTLTNEFKGYVTFPVTLSFITNYTANSSAFAIYNGENITLEPSYRPIIYSFKPNYTWYYLVKINSSFPVYINGVNTNEMWVKKGSVVVLNADIPSSDAGYFKGTYYLTLGQSVTVNQPIVENLVVIPKADLFTGILFFAVILIGILGFVAFRRRRKARKYRNWKSRRRTRGRRPYFD
ncbi:thermopsin family protease [Sulfolobus tengchongensis]|uniref:Thermopsin family protease n=1 Tax=Sulfolobus tengchongensis TaxID=207809 RepID=A0AAX4L2B4_9CREN